MLTGAVKIWAERDAATEDATAGGRKAENFPVKKSAKQTMPHNAP